MQEGKQDSYQRTVALVLAIVILGLAFLIIRPFIVAILTAAALSYIFYPVYKYIVKNIVPEFLPQETAGSMITCAIIILLVLIPAVFITSVVTYELRGGYVYLQQFLKSPGWIITNFPQNLTRIIGGPEQLQGIVGDIIGQLIDWLQNVLKSIPNLLLNIFITIFSTYYFLKLGREIYNFLKGLVPLPEKRHEQILSRFDDLSRGMIMGQIVVGAVQGLLAWAGFLFLGVPNPALWGFLTALISIIPLLGAVLVWLPIDIYLFAIGYTTGDYWRAIALLVYGTFVVSTIDNILKPKIVGQRAKIHPLVILFGILGGIQLFGIPGILIGPLVLTLFDLVIEIYRETL